jgi:hypothetical protein
MRIRNSLTACRSRPTFRPESGETVANPIPIPPGAGSKSRLFPRRDGIGTTKSRVNSLMGLSLDELYSQKMVTASKIPKRYFAGTGIGTGFCRVRDGRDRDEKTRSRRTLIYMDITRVDAYAYLRKTKI